MPVRNRQFLLHKKYTKTHPLHPVRNRLQKVLRIQGRLRKSTCCLYFSYLRITSGINLQHLAEEQTDFRNPISYLQMTGNIEALPLADTETKAETTPTASGATATMTVDDLLEALPGSTPLETYKIPRVKNVDERKAKRGTAGIRAIT